MSLIFTNNENASGIIKNHYAVQDELIERIIQQYKEENKYLKGLIDKNAGEAAEIDITFEPFMTFLTHFFYPSQT